MRILRLLNKKKLSIILIFLLFGLNVNAEDQVYIWNIDKKKIIEKKKTKKKSTKKILNFFSQKEQ